MLKKIFNALRGKAESGPSVKRDTKGTSSPLDDKWRSMSGSELFSLLTGPLGPADLEDYERFEAPYLRFVEQLEFEQRANLLLKYSEQVENARGIGLQKIVPFMLFDPHPSVSSVAAMHLAVQMPLEKSDLMTGVRWTIDKIMNSSMDDERKGAALRGIVLLGDRRVNVLMEKSWELLQDPGRVELSRAHSGFVLAGTVEFWIKCLENGCSDGVFGSVVAALCKMPKSSTMQSFFPGDDRSPRPIICM